MSSSRVHISLIGVVAPLALSTSASSPIQSDVKVARRPKLPPAYSVCSRTRSGAMPRMRATAAWSPFWFWMPAQMSQTPSRISPTLQSGSIAAWARYGSSKVASTTCAARAIAAAASPRCRQTTPSSVDAARRNSAAISLDERVSASVSSHSTTSARRPAIAAHVCAAITATPFGTRTTSSTPWTARAARSSTLRTTAPKRGARCSTATRRPGRSTSMPKTGSPCDLANASSRCTSLPTMRKRAGSLSVVVAGTGCRRGEGRERAEGRAARAAANDAVRHVDVRGRHAPRARPPP